MNGHPAVIPDQDIDAIHHMLQSNLIVSVEQKLQIGEKVVITKGDLTGYEGILLYCKGEHKFGIQLIGTNYIACVDIDLTMVRVLG